MELKWYYQVIRRDRRLIAFCTIVPGLFALLISLAMQPTYESRADVALYKTKADLVFDARFISLSEDDLVHYSNPDARRNTLVALATSGQVLSQTLSRLPEAGMPAWSSIRLMESIRVDTSGNLIQLYVQAPDSHQATLVANAWAEAFVEITNRTFGQPPDAIQTVAVQAEQALAQYSVSQQALQAFLEDNPIDELSLAIYLKENAVLSIGNAYYSASQAALENLLLVRSRLPLLVGNAQSLRQMVAAGPAGMVDLSTQLSTLLLQIGGLNMGMSLPAELQFALPAPVDGTLSRTETLAMLDQILAELTYLQEYLDELIIAQGTAVTAGLDTTLEQQLAAVQAEIDPLKASLEEQNAQLRELTSARDLAWENYLTLARKVAETTIADQTIETEVVLASSAVVPEEPIRPQKVLNTAIGCAFGMLAGLAFAFFRAHITENPLVA